MFAIKYFFVGCIFTMLFWCQTSIAQDIGSLVCHIQNEHESRFIQIDTFVDPEKNSTIGASIISGDIEVFASQDGLVIVADDAMFRLMQEEPSSTAILGNRPAEINCFEFNFDNLESAFLEKYNLSAIPELEQELLKANRELEVLRSQVNALNLSITKSKKDHEVDLKLQKKQRELAINELKQQLLEKTKSLNNISDQLSQIEDDNIQLSLKMESIKYNYFPYPELKDRLKSELHGQILNALNRCWVEPNTNTDSVIVMEIQHETANLVQIHTGVNEVRAIRHEQLDGLLNEVDTSGNSFRLVALFNPAVIKDKLSVSHENLRDAAVSALEKCRSDIFIPTSYFSEIFVVINKQGFQHIRW